MLMGEHERAKEIFDMCIKNARKLGDKSELAWIHDLLGQLFKRKGYYSLALEHYNISLQFNKDYNQKWSIAKNLLNVTEIYADQGSLELALECCNQSLLFFRKAGNSQHITDALYFKAKIFYEKNELVTAIKNLNESLSLLNEYIDPKRQTKVLLLLVIVLCDQKNFSKAETFLEKLNGLKNENKEDKEIEFYWKTARAYYLKQSRRLRNKMEAASIFNSIVKHKVSDFSLWTFVLRNISELCVLEYELTKNNEALQEGKAIIEKLRDLAQKQESKKLMIEVNLIISKIEKSFENFEKATEILNRAYVLAEESGLVRLKKILQYELKALSTMKTVPQRNLMSPSKYQEIETVKWNSLITPVNIPNNEHCSIKLIAYKWDELGFFPFAEAGTIKLSQIFKEKYGTFISIATSLGSEYRNGLFGPLPFSSHTEYQTVVYAEMV